ncbi:RHS repeat protein [Streptacidiphilus sp. 4-A2]|nr:RHS repeat protein [Streptacidiphilus sp. 4-A2]
MATAYALGTATWSTQTVYGGNFTTTIPPAGGVVQTVLTDARGRTTDLYQYHAGAPADPVNDPPRTTPTPTTATPAGQKAAETDPAGNTWTWSYNLLGQQTATTDPDSGSSSSVYDNAGQLLSTTNGDGKQTSYTYDLDGRKTASYDTSGGATESTADQIGAWTYDTLKKGYPTATTSYRMGTTSPSETSTVLAYNSFAEPAASKTTLANLPADEAGLAPSGGYTTSFEYNTAGNLTTQEDPAAGGLPAENIDYGRQLRPADQRHRNRRRLLGLRVRDRVRRVRPGRPVQHGPHHQLGEPGPGLRPADRLGHQRPDHRFQQYRRRRQHQLHLRKQHRLQGLRAAHLHHGQPERRSGHRHQCFNYNAQEQLDQAWTATDNCAATPHRGAAAPWAGRTRTGSRGHRRRAALHRDRLRHHRQHREQHDHRLRLSGGRVCHRPTAHPDRHHRHRPGRRPGHRDLHLRRRRQHSQHQRRRGR